MTLQSGVATEIRIKPETSFGVLPGATGASLLRRTSCNLNLTKDTTKSNEVRADQQIADFRHTARKVGGSLNGELSLESYDSLLEALLRGSWTGGASFTATTGAGITSNSGAKTFTRAGGSWLTDGFKIGDVVRFTGLAASANNGKNFRIVGLTATVMTVGEAVATDAVADESCACTVVGKKLITGTQKRSFTIEQYYADVDVAQVFSGCRIGSGRFSLQPSGIATVQFDMTGQDMALYVAGAAPYFTSPAAAPITSVLAGANGSLRLGGADIAVVTGLNLSVQLGLTAQNVVGASTVPDVFYGTTNVSGDITALFENEDLIENFLNEDEIELIAMLEAPGSDPKDFLTLRVHRLKLGSASINNQGEQGVPVSLQFQALLKAGGSGTAYDEASLVIQRSNS